MTEDDPKKPNNEGFTLVETVIAIGIFMTLFVAVWQAFDVTASETANGVASAYLDSSLRKCISRIAEDIADSGSDWDGTDYVLSHPETATTDQAVLTFQTRVGLTGTPVDWSDPVTFALVPSNGETPGNLVDDDGDGIVDEQLLVRSVDDGATVTSATISDGVTAVRFLRNQNTDVIQITVTAAGATAQGQLTRTLATSITLRNRN